MVDVKFRPVPQLTGESSFVLTDGSLVGFDSVMQLAMVSAVEIVEVRGERDGRMTIVLNVTPEDEESSHRYTLNDLPYFELVKTDGTYVDAEFVKTQFDRLVIVPMRMLHDVKILQAEASIRTAVIVLEELYSGAREYPFDVFYGGQALSDKLGIHEWPLEVVLVKENKESVVGQLDSEKR